jgi:hypothetical protein
MRRLLIATVGLAGVAAGVAGAAVTCVDSGFGYESCVINNGLAPPNPENVIADETYTEDQRVYVRNVQCPTDWGEPWVRGDGSCTSPGDPTEVEVEDGGFVSWLRVRDSSSVAVSGGTVRWYLRAYDSSSATLSGGWVSHLYAYDFSTLALSDGLETSDVSAYDSSTITMSGGTVQEGIWAEGSSNVTMSGGTVMGSLQSTDFAAITMSGGWVSQIWVSGSTSATISGGTVWSQLISVDSSTVTISGGTLRSGLGAMDSSNIRIEGSDFEVDEVSVPYGDLTAEAGELSGTLASGDLFDVFFYQGQGGGGYYAGTITLVEHVPEPAAVVLHACALLMLALLRMLPSSWMGSCPPLYADDGRAPRGVLPSRSAPDDDHRRGGAALVHQSQAKGEPPGDTWGGRATILS